MKDYSDLNLNNRLQNVNSLAVRRRGESFNPPTDFESQVDRGAVTRGKLGTISADVLKGGTLTLGGANNVNGVFSLQDEGGTEKISMDKDGMTVNDGVITIQDSAGSSVIDSSGVVSLTTFPSDSVEQPVEQATSSDTWADISGVSLNIPSLARDTKFLFLWTALLYAEDATWASVAVRLRVDDTTYRPWMILTQGDNPNVDRVDAQLSTFKFLTLGSGTHTVKLQFRKWETGAYGYADQIILSYIQLGK